MSNVNNIYYITIPSFRNAELCLFDATIVTSSYYQDNAVFRICNILGNDVKRFQAISWRHNSITVQKKRDNPAFRKDGIHFFKDI